MCEGVPIESATPKPPAEPMPPNASGPEFCKTNANPSAPCKEEPVLVRQLELERGVKAGPNRLFFAKPKSASFLCLGRRDPQDFAGNPGITHQAELLAGREIVEVDLGMRSIDGYGVCALPKASVTTPTAVKPGDLCFKRRAKRRSWSSVFIGPLL